MTELEKIVMTNNYLTISNEDIEKQQITFIAEGKEPLKIAFDYKNSLVPVKVRLRDDVYLTENECSFYLQLLMELTVCDELINAIMVEYVLNTSALDRRNSNVVALRFAKSRSMYIREFVKVHGYENIFFVADFNIEDGTLICVEVHKHKALTFGVSLFNISQVQETSWNGKHLSDEEIKSAFNSPHNDFITALLSIPESD